MYKIVYMFRIIHVHVWQNTPCQLLQREHLPQRPPRGCEAARPSPFYSLSRSARVAGVEEQFAIGYMESKSLVTLYIIYLDTSEHL